MSQHFYGRLQALKDKSGVVAIHLEDEREGRISMVEAMIRIIEDLVGVNQRLQEKAQGYSTTHNDATLADAVIDAMFEND